MLSIFPELLNYSQLSPLILRIALAVVFLYFGCISLKAEKTGCWKCGGIEGALKIIIGLFLLAGFLTQIAAILASLAMIAEATKEKMAGGFVKRKILKFLIFSIGASLALLGPGLLAIDLPL